MENIQIRWTGREGKSRGEGGGGREGGSTYLHLSDQCAQILLLDFGPVHNLERDLLPRDPVGRLLHHREHTLAYALPYIVVAGFKRERERKKKREKCRGFSRDKEWHLPASL